MGRAIGAAAAVAIKVCQPEIPACMGAPLSDGDNVIERHIPGLHTLAADGAASSVAQHNAVEVHDLDGGSIHSSPPSLPPTSVTTAPSPCGVVLAALPESPARIATGASAAFPAIRASVDALNALGVLAARKAIAALTTIREGGQRANYARTNAVSIASLSHVIIITHGEPCQRHI